MPPLIKSIIDGIQDKKGENISVVCLDSIEGALCNYFVICQAQTSNQLLAIADSVEEKTRVDLGVKPAFVQGTAFAHWVAMDYTDAIVHIMDPEMRAFYDIEHLWEDAVITQIPNID
ncbi:MAG: ribosome silencing factor [Bacteroidaceae bacterium]|nr:ribosome silencing factor [Bacteroidaceae bacterium]